MLSCKRSNVILKSEMFKNLGIYFCFILAFLSIIQCGSTSTIKSKIQTKAHKIDVFDDIITRNFFISSARKDADLNYRTDVIGATEKLYSAELNFEKNSPYQHYICTINIAKSGAFINKEKFEESYIKHKETLLKKHPGNWQEIIKIEYPDIGKRAIRDRGTFGPGGAMFSITFTSSDGLFDIKGSISNNLPEDVEDPELDLRDILRKISDFYDKQVEY